MGRLLRDPAVGLGTGAALARRSLCQLLGKPGAGAACGQGAAGWCFQTVTYLYKRTENLVVNSGDLRLCARCIS